MPHAPNAPPRQRQNSFTPQVMSSVRGTSHCLARRRGVSTAHGRGPSNPPQFSAPTRPDPGRHAEGILPDDRRRARRVQHERDARPSGRLTIRGDHPAPRPGRALHGTRGLGAAGQPSPGDRRIGRGSLRVGFPGTRARPRRRLRRTRRRLRRLTGLRGGPLLWLHRREDHPHEQRSPGHGHDCHRQEHSQVDDDGSAGALLPRGGG